MADMPRSSGHAPSGGVVDATSSDESTVPAWLAARRARVPQAVEPEPEPELEVEFAAAPETEESKEPAEASPALPPDPTADSIVTPLIDQAPDSPFLLTAPASKASTSKPVPVIFPAAPISAPAPTRPKGPLPLVAARDSEAEPPEDNSFKGRMLRWARSSVMAGILFSLLVHTVIMSVLAVLVMGGASLHPGLDLFGVMADSNAVSDLVLDSAMPIDPGQDAAALEFPDMSKFISTEQADFNPSTSLKGSIGGTGTGNGEGGEGAGMSVGALNIPKYAVTKGSFSAWTDPKDPEPGFSYQIVIQFRLPANVKVYRGSDLTGMVIGTDGYKQAIRLSKNETFTVQDGSVQIRQFVPRAAKLVRDTIRVESKLLREKQVIEIEF
ncbi:hypothetical protein DAPPUDRAFT_343875 [Daphnia pulex]|uniref:Uncharacterized protein n=1 Tax=Daphnia pulex TaxID=6669 RepID=E9I6G2_DAPPU|nr:hypothetical protein DAPPUDRAFT_343875 [Daphnia pulex]|eukprot:EFX60418.1 hypothetical protein DAPPUDRAFT_343875 [Daphnia pulex]